MTLLFLRNIFIRRGLGSLFSTVDFTVKFGVISTAIEALRNIYDIGFDLLAKPRLMCRIDETAGFDKVSVVKSSPPFSSRSHDRCDQYSLENV